MVRNKVNVLGWYNHDNCGDEAYKLAFPKIFPNCDLIFTDKPIKADAYILGGGDTVSDYFLNSLLKIDAPKHMMSVTLREEVDPELLDQFSSIFVRDFESLRIAESKGIRASFVPDFTFVLEPNQDRGKAMIEKWFKAEGHDLYTRRIAVIINGHLVPDHQSLAIAYTRFEKFCYDLAVALDHIDASFIFIPFGKRMPWDDRAAHAMTASRCKFWKKNLVVYDTLEPQEILDVISAVDAVVSTRLHSSIFSCIAGTPFADVVHNHKNKYFLESIEYEYFMTYGSFGQKVFQSLIESVIEEAGEIRASLLETTKKARDNIRGVATNVSFV